MTGVLWGFGRDSHPSFTGVCLNRHQGPGRVASGEYSMQYVHCIR